MRLAPLVPVAAAGALLAACGSSANGEALAARTSLRSELHAVRSDIAGGHDPAAVIVLRAMVRDAARFEKEGVLPPRSFAVIHAGADEAMSDLALASVGSRPPTARPPLAGAGGAVLPKTSRETATSARSASTHHQRDASARSSHPSRSPARDGTSAAPHRARAHPGGHGGSTAPPAGKGAHGHGGPPPAGPGPGKASHKGQGRPPHTGAPPPGPGAAPPS